MFKQIFLNIVRSWNRDNPNDTISYDFADYANEYIMDAIIRELKERF